MQEITVTDLKSRLDAGEDIQVIDIREDYEYQAGNINGEHIKMGDVMMNIEKISKHKPVVLHCRSGGRSGAILQALQQHHGFDNLLNLKGGITAWSNEIDSSIEVA